ncbi:type VI secretion protein [Methylocystis sp. MitZ-2018]|nr:type VI secretion protein [Methylocystis sp. MitZ-2018]
MSDNDDDLRIRPGRIRHSRSGRAPKSFVGQVLKAANKAGGVGARGRLGRAPRSIFGRGRARALAAERGLFSNARRVIVKARVVLHKGHAFRSAPIATHVAYLRREGVSRDEEKARMFDAHSDSADPAAFVDRCKDDRHHFRFIVSPEDATELEDLRAFTRDFMREAERDLGTKLDWVGVDHWNTDNPHIHVLVRGKADDGHDLVISRDYISSGMRVRAEHLVSLELGPKSELQMYADLAREVDAERWTRLDRAIAASADEDGVIDLRPAANQSNPELQSLKIGRLQRLTRLGLATSIGPAQWILAEPAETTLRDLGLRGDIIKTMHRALTEARIERSTAEFAIHREAEDAPIVGRLIARGLSDELTEKAYAIVDGADGRIHHLTFPNVEATSDAAPGAIVELRRYTDARGAERIAFAVRSDLSLADQVKAEGATWLDRRLVERMETPLAHAGFGQEVREALSARIEHLAGVGLASRQGQRVTFARDLLATLRRRELDAVGAKLASETGRSYRPTTSGANVAGVYRQRLSLASGRFAMIDDGLGFQLVPWSPSLEPKRGQHISGVMSPGGVDWSFGRKRGLGI